MLSPSSDTGSQRSKKSRTAGQSVIPPGVLSDAVLTAASTYMLWVRGGSMHAATCTPIQHPSQVKAAASVWFLLSGLARASHSI